MDGSSMGSKCEEKHIKKKQKTWTSIFRQSPGFFLDLLGRSQVAEGRNEPRQSEQNRRLVKAAVVRGNSSKGLCKKYREESKGRRKIRVKK